jgi:hypothetical protein
MKPIEEQKIRDKTKEKKKGREAGGSEEGVMWGQVL